MEAVSAAANIIAVLQLVERITLLCSRYVKAVKGAKSDIERLQRELEGLRHVLNGVHQLVQGPSGARLETSQLLMPALQRCFTELDGLGNTLEQPLAPGKRGRLLMRFGLRDLKWPFQSAQIDRTVESLTKFRDTFSAALNLDQTRLLSKHLERVEDEECREILEWVSPIPYGKQHDTVKEARTPDTCEWLLQHKKFGDWNTSSSSVILWLQGSPGAGKTFLTSKVIDHVLSSIERSPGGDGFAFFYCNRNEENRRKPLSVLRSFVRQLATAPGYPKEIQRKLREMWRDRATHGSELGIANCRVQLLESVNLFPRTTLILDALDECEPSSRSELISTIEFLLSKSNNALRVFISSRPDRDIRRQFADKPNIEIQARHNEGDITKFVQGEVMKHGNWKGMSQTLQNEIVHTLLQRSEGMFQWVFLQTQQLLELETEPAIRDRLGKIPPTLEATYDEIYSKIQARNHHDRILADRAFQWVMCASTPFTSVELLSAIRLGSESDVFSLEPEITESQLLHLCNHLLLIDSLRGVWRFSHLSVVEYFEKTRWSLRQVHYHAAVVSLKLLLETYDDARCGDPEPHDQKPDVALEVEAEDDAPDILHPRHPFQNYVHGHLLLHAQAQREWEEHEAELKPEFAKLLKAFLGPPNNSSSQYRRWHRQMATKGQSAWLPGFRGATIKNISPEDFNVLAACYGSVSTAIHDWWANAPVLDSVENEVGENLLLIAAEGGDIPMVKVLLDHGIAINGLASCARGHALAATASKGDLEMVKFLVSRGADVKLQLKAGDCGSALTAAALQGNLDVIQFLIEQGVDINVEDQHGQYGSALVAASARKDTEALQLLTQHSPNINLPLRCGYYGSALAAASNLGRTEAVQLLLQGGADANMQVRGRWYGSALCAAAAGGKIEEIGILIQHGADVNMQVRHGRHGSALAAAASQSNTDTVDFLIQQGADVNMKLRYGPNGCALAAAVVRGHHGIVQFLVDQGADFCT
ncbi:uncharacterized protein C8A04DRAFT_33579 [Dichotomopilus funicola]|uniref:Nephrocystin 3-like N-terminal domain-containing protein n=1 Tax=Dichotomopilus funicola TaxID=1934379 RepID=A0AAN6VB22_9PEZI|nr:hypothetical protein C8A04DRAFT_33579 [Dichotomopilus funicola]